jgi:hypothetical protein
VQSSRNLGVGHQHLFSLLNLRSAVFSSDIAIWSRHSCGDILYWFTSTLGHQGASAYPVVQKDWHKLLKTAEEDVLIVQSMVEAIASGTIVPSMLSSQVTIEDVPGGKTVSVSRDRPILQEDLKSWAQHVQFSLLSTWILIVDQALEAKYGEHRSQDTDLDRQAVRCVIYQMRCAFAHSGYAPRWQVSKGYQISFTLSNLTSGSIILNFSQLNGQPFKPSQLGGWYKVFELLKYAQRLL